MKQTNKEALMKKGISALIIMAVVLSLPLWSSGKSEKREDGKIVLTLADNNPDITSGAGWLLAQGMEEFQKIHPEVEFDLVLNDNETHRQKLKIWIAANEVPDIYANWADPAAVNPFVRGGYAAGLEKEMYGDYKFLPGSLEELTVDGTLYGLPRNFDIWTMFYNKELFEENGLQFPKTFDEMLEVAKVFNEKGIIPCALNGRDKWNQVVLLSDLVMRTSGDSKLYFDAAEGKSSFSQAADAKEASSLLMKLVENDFFQKGYIVDDYATAQSYFTSGKAAMYWIGTWEMGMGAKEDIPAEIRDNMRAGFMPSLASPDTNKALVGRTGMAYFVNDKADEKKKELAKEFVSFLFKPENWTRWAWEKGILTPAQSWADYTPSVTNPLVEDVTRLFDEVSLTTGQPLAWVLNSAYEQEVKNKINDMMIGDISQDEFWEALDLAAAENR